MSKSLGNFFSVRELLDQGYPGEVIRWLFLKTHYRKPFNVSESALNEAKRELASFYEFAPDLMVAQESEFSGAVLAALLDDLNLPAAIAALHELKNSQNYQELAPAMNALGFTGSWCLPKEPELSYRGTIEMMVADLEEARRAKDFSYADRIRNGLVEAGIKIEIGKERIEWRFTVDFDPVKLEALK